MGNPPITYIRQLITVCLSPKKYLDPEHRWDVRGRMKEILTAMGEMPADLREGMMGVVDGMTPEAEERVRELYGLVAMTMLRWNIDPHLFCFWLHFSN